VSIKVVRETHDTPEYVSQRLAAAGGYNRFGEPNYRAVWGWNRLTLIGGKWEQTTDGPATECAYRWVPKYPQVNRWHIERWVPPEDYGSRWTWGNGGTMEKELGPYPWRGEYEHSCVIEGPRGEFVQLTPTIVEHIARSIEWSRRHWNKGLERKRLYDREAKKDDEYLRWADMVMDDNPTWSYTPHTYIPANLKEKMNGSPSTSDGAI
jgi:hypothetical protein